MLKGTSWTFNTVLDFTTTPPPIGYMLYNENGLFTCDNVTYYGIEFLALLLTEEVQEMGYNTSYSQTITAYNNNNNTWADNRYKSITFINELDMPSLSDQLQSWLEANAVKTADTNSYSVTGDDLISIADAIREKTGGTIPLVFPDDFTDGIDLLIDTSDADATAEFIHVNKTAYVNGEKITGTGRIIRTRQLTEIWPSSQNVVPAGGCIKQTVAFQVASMKGIDNVSTTSSLTIGSQAEFSYNQTILSGERRVHMYFNNLTNSEITIPANAFTSVLTYIY